MKTSVVQNVTQKLQRKRNLLPIILLLFFSLFMFRKIVTDELYPFPGNLLVTFFFPWQNGGFEGYDSFTTSKDFNAADAIRQDIPWRYVAIEQLKNFELPFWNPFSFSGTPLMANFQSAAFYPGNVVFFLMPFFYAWNVYIILQTVLASLFTYLFLRKINRSQTASIVRAVSLVTSSYILVWLEIGIIGHAVLWFPFFLWCIENILERPRGEYFVLLTVSTVFSLLAGYLQAGMHLLLIAGLYWLVGIYSRKFPIASLKKQLLLVGLWSVLSVGGAAFQLLPTVELKDLSPLNEAFTKDVYRELKTPWKNMWTILAPDYFGNPANRNFNSEIYGEGTPFVSALSVSLVLIALYYLKEWRVRFWGVVGVVYLLFGFPGPVFYVVDWLQIDLFTGTLSSRALIIFLFAQILLMTYGYDHLVSVINKKHLPKPIVIIGGIHLVTLGLMWLIAVLDRSLSTNILFQPADAHTALRNLVIPTVVIICVVGLVLLNRVFPGKKLQTLLSVVVIGMVMGHGLYHANKILPFSPKKFFFPDHPMIEYVQNNTQIDRFAGLASAKFDKNFSMVYGIHSPEGYDSLRINRYAQLFAAHTQETNQVPEVYSKSDSDFGLDASHSRTRLMDLLGVTYLFDKSEGGSMEWDPEPYRFPFDTVELVWQQQLFKVYKRPTAVERISLIGDYEVIPDDAAIIQRLYDPEFNPHTSLILEQPLETSAEIRQPNQSQVELVTYKPNQITIKTNSDTDALLLLTDAHYPGWKALVDGSETEIYRANYAFRSIVVPQGDHVVEFIYFPKSFEVGVYISLISFALIFGFWFITSKKHW